MGEQGKELREVKVPTLVTGGVVVPLIRIWGLLWAGLFCGEVAESGEMGASGQAAR